MILPEVLTLQHCHSGFVILLDPADRSKAMLVVHPDKVTGSPANIQVIAKYAFENLNAAYEKFEAAEMKSSGS